MTEENSDCFKIPDISRRDCDIMSAYMISAGGGSAYGGKCRPNPNKPDDQRLVGRPGEIKRTVMRNGAVYLTKIGDDCVAEKERHLTDHNQPDKHTPVHDHIITRDEHDGHPVFSSPINYYGEIPEFKRYIDELTMDGMIGETIIVPPDANLNFESASEFKKVLSWGAEIQFDWKGHSYGVIRYGTNNKITAYEIYKPETEKVYETPDDALEFMLGEDKLRDVITKVEVTERTL